MGRCYYGLAVDRAYRPPRTLLPVAVGESPKEPNLHLHSIHYPGGESV